MQVVLVGVVNMNVAESRCPAAAWSCGRSMGAWWTKMGLAVPDVVGVVNVAVCSVTFPVTDWSADVTL